MAETSEFKVGERGVTRPQITQFTPSPFRKARVPDPLHFEVNIVAEAHERQKKSGVVEVNIPGFSPARQDQRGAQSTEHHVSPRNQHLHTPKSSVNICSGSTPRSSSITRTARIIKGGPHR